MLRIILILFIFLSAGLLFAEPEIMKLPVKEQETVFVALSGNDANDGLSEANAVATIAKGLEITRNKNIKNLSVKGKHRIETPIILTPQDSGLTVTGHGIIDGSRTITNWKPYKNGIWQAEIPEVKDGKWSFRQIYVGGELRQRAKTPNENFYRVAACPEGTPKTVHYHTDCQSFEFKPNDINPNWKNLDDVEVIVYYFWSDNHLPIESVDTEKNIVRFKYKGGKTFTDDFSEDGARYIVENVFEALDQPGEWYLDKVTGIIYYMPKEGEDLNKIEIIAPFAKELLRFDGKPADNSFVSGIHFKNISFQYCNFELPPGKVNDHQGSSEVAAAVNLTGVKKCTFMECTFSNLGTFGMELKSGCSSVDVADCRFENLAAGGIRINGGGAGSHPLVHTKNNNILRNEIVNYGQIYPSAVGIIVQNSCGNTIAANHIHHGYYTGISLGWVWGYSRSISRDNIVEHNHIHHIGQGLLSDMGAVYTLGPSPGTIIRNNLIHDIDANKYGGWGIYNDEGSTGILIEKNIVYNTKFAGYDMHYSKEITIRNNIFALGRKDQINRTRGEKHPSLYFENNIIYWKEGTLFSGDWNDKEYKYYTNPNQPDGSDRKRNFESNWNVFYNPNLKVGEVKFGGGSFDDWKKRGYDNNSVYADPMFVDPDKFDFRLKPESPALKFGFEEIDLSLVPER
ncbi:MAG: right-handed parallel beta-helix repeat-containing protein [Planctomycetaceae bacterium]|jgi:parallel beta-helix repeat protein|nr:right-handed parallel beta-helix repeat-containing protein [Planctomycetaceae bacterium]